MSEERHDDESQAQPVSSTGFGAELRAARESHKLSAIELADKLKLSSAMIEALEAEDLETLPAATFVRGYIRAVATELELDSDALVERFNRMAPRDENELSSTVSAVRQPSSKDPAMVYGTAIIAVLLVILLAVWGIGALSDDAAESEAPTAESTEPVAPETEDTRLPAVGEDEAIPDIQLNLDVPGAPLDESGEPMDSDASLEESSAPESEEGGASETAGAETEKVETTKEDTIRVEQPANISRVAPEGSDEVLMEIVGESWAEVRDANEHAHVFGMVDAGDSPMRLVGQAPFQVFLGDARQVSLSLNGAAYDHSRHIRSNHVAQFRLR